MKTAIIGGGAAGFFLAINLKEMFPEMEVTIFEKSRKVLSKVRISGGGRCNCTNTFKDITDLSHVYPRGYRLLKRLFNAFDHQDAYRWFENHGVSLTVQEDGCVFPSSQFSETIINCFTHTANRLGVEIQLETKINSFEELHGYDYIAVTTGGSPRIEGLSIYANTGHKIVSPVPSLFSFNIDDKQLCELMGTVIENVTAIIPSSKFRAQGTLLITHWGVSGPAILKLSSYAARFLNEQAYQSPLSINWTNKNDAETMSDIIRLASDNIHKIITNTHLENISQRLWNYLIEKAIDKKCRLRWTDLSQKDINRIVNTLCNDNYHINGRSTYKEEFVTCGGISLSSINPTTLESRCIPNLFFAGEILDFDGITGGFNFQAAWTTAYTVAQAITNKGRHHH